MYCVCFACGLSKRLDAHSICFVCVLYVRSYLLILKFENWVTGVRSSYVDLCVILHTMSFPLVRCACLPSV